MTEQQFLDECERILAAIEDGLDAAEVDVDAERSGHVLTLEFADRSKIIVNGNAPMKQMWVAAPSGGFHYQRGDSGWRDTRSGDELFAALSALVSARCGATVRLENGDAKG